MGSLKAKVFEEGVDDGFVYRDLGATLAWHLDRDYPNEQQPRNIEDTKLLKPKTRKKKTFNFTADVDKGILSGIFACREPGPDSKNFCIRGSP